MKVFSLLLSLLLSLVAFSQRMDSIRYESGYLYYHTYGQGEPVILLTGGPGASYQQLEPVAIRLGKTHQAILLEQRGTGRSQPKPSDTSTINIRTARQDLVRLLDHLQLKQATFLGHSWGGMLAMNFAVVYPERVKSLVLVDSGPFRMDRRLGEIYSANMDARLSAKEKEERSVIFQKWRSGNVSDADREAYYRWELVPVLYDRTKVDSLMVTINKGGLNPRTGSMLMQSIMQSDVDVALRLGKLNAPIHLIAGAQDPGGFMSYEIKLIAPQAQLHWVNKAGHFPMYEQPDAFYKVLENVLSKR